VCCGGSGILLEARRWVFLVERSDIGIRVRLVPRQRRQIRSVGLLSCLFLFASLFWSLFEHEVYKKHCSVSDLVRPMVMKKTRRWHWLVFWRCVSLVDLSRQTNKPFASALNYFFLYNACLILYFCFICSSATSESLWYFKLVTYLRSHLCANNVYMAIGCIMMQFICLLSMSSPC
jgi:hypothetical protein